MMKYAVFALVLASGVLARPQKKSDEVTIVKSEQQNNDDGSFSWLYETSDGSKQQQSGYIKPGGEEGILSVTGSFAYVSPDGTPIEVKYAADENGFQPTGDHLPTPPPIPEAIQKALDIILRNADAQTNSRG